MTYTGNPDDTVDGVICQCLTQKDIEALDVFEGDVSEYLLERKRMRIFKVYIVVQTNSSQSIFCN